MKLGAIPILYFDRMSSGEMTPKDGIERFWRNLIAGAASCRFHRDGAGIGLNELAQACIRSARKAETLVKLWDVDPHMELLSGREENEAYIAAKPGEKYILFFTDGGSVDLDLAGFDGRFTGRWVSVRTGEWGQDLALEGGGRARISAPSAGPWVAALVKMDTHQHGLIDDFGLPRFEEAIRQFPGIAWLCHSQPWWAFISGDVSDDEWSGYPKGPVVEGGRVIELVREYPNVYGDLSAGSGYNAISRDPEFGYWSMNEFQDQLCFGTDARAISHRDDRLVWLADFMKDGLATGKISQEAFEKIGRENAERVLK